MRCVAPDQIVFEGTFGLPSTVFQTWVFLFGRIVATLIVSRSFGQTN